MREEIRPVSGVREREHGWWGPTLKGPVGML